MRTNVVGVLHKGYWHGYECERVCKRDSCCPKTIWVLSIASTDVDVDMGCGVAVLIVHSPGEDRREQERMSA